MARRSFVNSAAAAALALASISSAPAFAAEPDEVAAEVSVTAEPAPEAPREWRQQRNDEGGARQAREQARQEARQAEMPQARAEARSEGTPQWQGRQGRTWQGGSDGNTGGGWQARAQEQQAQQQAQQQARAAQQQARAEQQQAEAQAQQAQQQARAQQQAHAGWGDRNRTYSDPQRSRQGWNGGSPQWQGRDHDHDHDQARNQSWGGWQNQERYGSGQYQGQYQGQYGSQYGTQYGSQYQNRDRYRQAYNGGNYREWNDDWRRDRRYDWQSYRYSNRDLYRGGSYYSPYRNYSYSRLSIGFFIDSLFYSNRYWINDPGQYRLPQVYGPYRWVRYYDDVLLIDVFSGEVVDAIYGFFW